MASALLGLFTMLGIIAFALAGLALVGFLSVAISLGCVVLIRAMGGYARSGQSGEPKHGERVDALTDEGP